MRQYYRFSSLIFSKSGEFIKNILHLANKDIIIINVTICLDVYLENGNSLSSSRVLAAICLSVTLIISSSIIPSRSFSQETGVMNTAVPCNCVVFIMDSIQDYWIEQGQITPMDLFISKNQSLSLGLVMSAVGNDPKILNKVRDGSSRGGLFELAINGWNHTDYTKLSQKEQEYSLNLSNQKMQMLFGNTSDIFMPPEGSFNTATINAMNTLDLKILNSPVYAEDNFNRGKSIFIADSKIANKANEGVFHLPSSISLKDQLGDKWIKISVENILNNITQNIGEYGYAVITLSPQHFMKVDANGRLTDTLDEEELKELSRLIDSVLSQNIKITSFSKIVGIEPKVYPYLPTCTALLAVAVPKDYFNLRPSDPISLDELRDIKCQMAEIYNNYGKYLNQKASQLGISPATAAAVLFVESSGSAFGPDGRMIIRFEACAFNDIWGNKHPQEFSKYFECERPNDKFRASAKAQFADYHGDHLKEWRVFDFARNLDEEAAMKSISMGLAQIMGFNYDKVGYRSVKEMFDNMSSGAKSQLDAFFLGLSNKNNNSGKPCLDALKTNNYVAFAGCYNAAGQDYLYGSQITKAVTAYMEVTSGKLYANSVS